MIDIENFEQLEEFIKNLCEKYSLSTTHTENDFKVYYPSSKAVREGLEKSMS